MRYLAVLATPLILTGCGIPPAVTIATYALDGAVWIGSGKTVRDHALSAALEQDCSMFRVLGGNPICVDYTPDGTAAAALATMPAGEAMLGATSDGRVIRVAAASSPADQPVMAAAGSAGTAAAVAANAPVAPAEAPLLTLPDGRSILVARQPAATAAAGEQPTLIQLSWVMPSLDLPATQ